MVQIRSLIPKNCTGVYLLLYCKYCNYMSQDDAEWYVQKPDSGPNIAFFKTKKSKRTYIYRYLFFLGCFMFIFENMWRFVLFSLHTSEHSYIFPTKKNYFCTPPKSVLFATVAVWFQLDLFRVAMLCQQTLVKPLSWGVSVERVRRVAFVGSRILMFSRFRRRYDQNLFTYPGSNPEPA